MNEWRLYSGNVGMEKGKFIVYNNANTIIYCHSGVLMVNINPHRK